MNLIDIPIRCTKFVFRHPIVTIGVCLLGFASIFLGALQLSPLAQKHFNAAIESFGYSTASMVLSSSADAMLSVSNAKNTQLASQLDVATSELDSGKKQIDSLQQEVKTKQQRITQIDAFQKKANGIVKKHNVRLTKAVIKTATGEVIAWVPVVGDIASMYFAVDGTIEMCNMFRELETTALEYGLPFYMYSGTFCDDPIGKSKAIVLETSQDITDSVTDSLRQQSVSRTDYWSKTFEDAANYMKSFWD